MKKLKVLSGILLALSLLACAKPEDVSQAPASEKPADSCTMLEDLRSTEEMIRLSCPMGKETCEMRKYPHITLLLCSDFSNWMDGGYETETK